MNESFKSYRQNFILPETCRTQLEIFKDVGLFIQHASAAHSAQMGISINALQAAGFSWVLARQQTLLLQLPQPGEEIEIETWPSELTRLKCCRDFTVRDKEGKILGHSLTEWVVLNMETRRAERVPDFIVARHPSEVRHAMPEINIKPVQLEPAQTAANTTARSGDIDMNNHVTNTRYVDFMLDNVPGEVRSGRRPVFSDIIYRAEALEGDNIEIRRTEADPDEVCGSMPELDTFITEYKCLAFWHNLVKSKSRFLFITREKEKELVRGFTLWA